MFSDITKYLVVAKVVDDRLESDTVRAECQLVLRYVVSSTRISLGLNSRHRTCAPKLDLRQYQNFKFKIVVINSIIVSIAVYTAEFDLKHYPNKVN